MCNCVGNRQAQSTPAVCDCQQLPTVICMVIDSPVPRPSVRGPGMGLGYRMFRQN